MNEMNNSSNNNKSSMSSREEQETVAPSVPENSIRKYLVLLHDCLAIKFVPLSVDHHHRCSSPFHLNSRPSSRQRTSTPANFTNPNQSNYYNSNNNHNSNNNNEDHQGFDFNSKSNGRGIIKGTLENLNSVAEVDHSLHGLYLYKGFREANLQCYWNGGLWDAIRNLEYKGYIVPSTLLIWSLPRFLMILRQAWSRQMLRSPPGYRIEFVGEIEELIADPIQQSQFAPLSDSLCWAILEITSLGQEAFVDSILLALKTSFPTMVYPSKELIYQTLEKLIRERKIYQTSRGYFVVTHDTFRYMISSNEISNSPIPPQTTTFSTNTLTIDEHEIITRTPVQESDKVSRNSWESTHSDSAKKESIPLNSSNSKKPLRRHNSLKIIRQRDKESSGPIKFLRGRSLSFRLYKSKSTPLSGGGGGSNANSDERVSSSKENNAKSEDYLTTSEEPTKSKGSKSFFKRLFKRSSSKSKTVPVDSRKDSSKISIETQTPTEVEKTMPIVSDKIALATPLAVNKDNSSSIKENQSEMIERSFTLPHNYGRNENYHLRWTSLPIPKQQQSEEQEPVVLVGMSGIERPTSRLSIDGPLYATIKGSSNSSNYEETPMCNNGNHVHSNYSSLKRGCSSSLSRCSTLSSQGTSLGYGSQGQTSLGFHSPCPTPASNYPESNSNSLTRNSYKSYYDYYRRRYPGYGSTKSYRPLSGPPSSTNRYEVIRDKMTTPNQATMTVTKPKEIALPNPNSTTTTTTKVTQNSTTNMEVELRLPLRKLMGTNLEVTSNNHNHSHPKGSGCSNSSSGSGDSTITKVNVNVGSTTSKSLRDEQQQPTKITTILGHSSPNHSSTTQHSETIKTIVNTNGRIETHFDMCPNTNTNTNSGIELTTSNCNKPTEIQLTTTTRQGGRNAPNWNDNKGVIVNYGRLSNCASCQNGPTSPTNCVKEDFI